MNKQNERILAGARNWANANKSDPFAFSVAMSHFKNGISDVHDGEDMFYTATPTPTGSYIDLKRP